MARPSGTENPGGWGVKLEKPSVGGYGYFLEPHNMVLELSNIHEHQRKTTCKLHVSTPYGFQVQVKALCWLILLHSMPIALVLQSVQFLPRSITPARYLPYIGITFRKEALQGFLY